MQSKYDSMHNDTWYLTELPYGKKAIRTKWVYKLKQKADGLVDHVKARLVAKGYAQQKGIDFEETFAPTSRMTTIRCMIALATYHAWQVHQLDIKSLSLMVLLLHAEVL